MEGDANVFPLQQEKSQLANTWLRGPEMIWLLRHFQDGAPGSKTRQLLRATPLDSRLSGRMRTTLPAPHLPDQLRMRGDLW